MIMKKNKRRYQFPDGSNYPIVESTDSGTLIVVQEQDCEYAIKRDPTACAIAQAAVRMGYERAFIAGTVAYLVTTVKGEQVAMKFSVPERTRKAIKEFDETGEMPPEGFVLNRLHPHQTRVNKQIANGKRTPEQRKWSNERRRQRKLRGSNAYELRTFRYLSGQVHTLADV
jgi:hypothetical protein